MLARILEHSNDNPLLKFLRENISLSHTDIDNINRVIKSKIEYIFLDLTNSLKTQQSFHLLFGFQCHEIGLIALKPRCLQDDMINKLVGVMRANNRIIAVNLPNDHCYKITDFLVDDIFIGKHFLINLKNLFGVMADKNKLALLLASAMMPQLFEIQEQTFEEYLTDIEQKKTGSPSYVESIILNTKSLASPIIGGPLSIGVGLALCFLVSQFKGNPSSPSEGGYTKYKLTTKFPDNIPRHEIFSLVVMLVHCNFIHVPLINALQPYKDTMLDCLIKLLGRMTTNSEKWKILASVTKPNNLLGAIFNYQRTKFGYYVGSYFKDTNTMQLLIKLREELRLEINEEVQALSEHNSFEHQ